LSEGRFEVTVATTPGTSKMLSGEKLWAGSFTALRAWDDSPHIIITYFQLVLFERNFNNNDVLVARDSGFLTPESLVHGTPRPKGILAF
jgi:hypothetical protein